MIHSQKNVFQDGVRNVVFPVGQDKCPGYLSPLCKTADAGIVVIQEWWGLNVSITLTADHFAKQGLVTLVPDLYRSKTAVNAEEASHKMQGLNFPNAAKDVNAARQHLKKLGCKRVYITGFCMGGALTIFTSALYGGFNKAFPFYGVPQGISQLDLSKIDFPFVAFFGKNDEAKGFSDLKTANQLKNVFQKWGKTLSLVVYQDAGHAFMNRDRPQAFNQAAYQASMKRIMEEIS